MILHFIHTVIYFSICLFLSTSFTITCGKETMESESKEEKKIGWKEVNKKTEDREKEG